MRHRLSDQTRASGGVELAETRRHPNRRRTIVLVVVAIIVVAAAIVGITYLVGNTATPSGSDDPGPTETTETTAPAEPDAVEDGDDVELSPTPFRVLPERMGGQEAIDALGDKIEIVAKRNGKTVEELEELLLRDKSAQVSTDGFIVYLDSFDKGD